MKWKKKGFIFAPNGEYEWMNSHICPLAVVVLEECVRVFFSSRTAADQNGNYISYPSYFDVSKDNPQRILYIHNKPIIELGRAGAFDQHGIMVLKPLFIDDRLFLYYAGWNRLASPNAPYQINVGLAVSNDCKTFKKFSEGPILGIDTIDPLGVGNVYVIKSENYYHMFYTSILYWEEGPIKPAIMYDIKHAISNDAIHWEKDGKTIIPNDEKGGVVAPTVFYLNGVYRMLFGYRKAFDDDGMTGRYKMGYAESDDLINWKRDDSKAGIDPSDSGWDSEMICYPHVVDINGQITMFYCGNGFGRGGMGYAILEEG